MAGMLSTVAILFFSRIFHLQTLLAKNEMPKCQNFWPTGRQFYFGCGTRTLRLTMPKFHNLSQSLGKNFFRIECTLKVQSGLRLNNA